MKNKTTAIFSGPLFKQTCRANIVLVVAILIVMIMMANVTNYAMSIMATDTKDGIGENLIKQANDALEARELIKCRVLENSMLTPREACDILSKATRSEQVQVIGTKFVLYRESHRKDKTDKIVLVKDKKKQI